MTIGIQYQKQLQTSTKNLMTVSHHTVTVTMLDIRPLPQLALPNLQQAFCHFARQLDSDSDDDPSHWHDGHGMCRLEPRRPADHGRRATWPGGPPAGLT